MGTPPSEQLLGRKLPHTLLPEATTKPETFHVTLKDTPCSAWSNGAHIVADGACRCGLQFALVVGR